MDSPRKALAHAFIITLAAGSVAATTPGCGDSVTFENPEGCPTAAPGNGDSCNNQLECRYEEICGGEYRWAKCDGSSWDVTIPPPCNPPPCPDSEPAEGSACEGIGAGTCSYGECDEVFAICTDSGWSLSYEGSCNPPPPECPAALPVNGAICEPQPDTWGEYPFDCHYNVEAECGIAKAIGNCVYSELAGEQVWEVTLDTDCVAPAEQCHNYDHETLCDADSGCRWLVPGCAESGGAEPIAAGCYPAAECDSTSCGNWGSCTNAVADPCYQSYCNACAAEVNVCVANE